MRLLMIVALLALLTGPGVGRAAGGPHGEGYVEIEAGLVIPGDSSSTLTDIGYDPGWVAAVRAGGHATDHIRVDMLLAWRRASTGSLWGAVPTAPFSLEADIVTVTGNVFYDVLSRDAFINPYVGGGVGLAAGWLDPAISSALLGVESAATGFAYVGEAGVHVRVADSLRIKAGYRYVGTVALFNATTPFFEGVDFGAHELVVGLAKEF
jgi:opacity protein-like surface antigen